MLLLAIVLTAFVVINAPGLFSLGYRLYYAKVSHLPSALGFSSSDRLLVLSPHPDHRAVGDLAIRVLGERSESDKLHYWIVHGGPEWPLPKGLHQNLPLNPPPRGRGLDWTRLPLGAEEIQKKLQSIQLYHT